MSPSGEDHWCDRIEHERDRVKEAANRDLDRIIDQALARINDGGNGDVNVLDSAGDFPLYSAAAGGRYDETRPLLERGANASVSVDGAALGGRQRPCRRCRAAAVL
ncbi:hypothetical protein EDB81DRAFT_888150 [Dactylonectria macrodidyma]|uniref:Ankyrin repeat domain-containing protein n=1 Tax=Dactylonectria macrodidyma TaxID=307937 RepID=A0A9P9E4N4_9HYPO|nr:hypothetical protein EDB81DRAFT_888150 [Dactylonectria macrodidyma]